MTFERRPKEMKEQAVRTSRGACSSRGNPGAKAGVQARLCLGFEQSWEASVVECGGPDG